MLANNLRIQIALSNFIFLPRHFFLVACDRMLSQFEGVPTYPDASRYWSIVAKYKVTKFYTAPTAIRALMKFGEGPVKR